MYYPCAQEVAVAMTNQSLPKTAEAGLRRPPFRGDHVGSFLRPPELLAARERFRLGEIDRSALRAVEDQAIRGVVKMQEDAGLLGITDGEFRRTFFHVDFLEQLAGVVTKGAVTVKFHNRAGDVDFAPPVMSVTGKVGHVRPIQRDDFQFLASVTTKTPKVSIPSPTMLHFRGGRAAISAEAYPDLDPFFDDVAAAYRAEIRSLAAAGCRYLQLDDTNLAYLCDPEMRRGVRARGDDPDELPRRYARFINAAIADRPPGLTICVHLCRGNFKSAWVAEGSYEPVAEVLFNELAVDGYFLEYDDERSGDFAPLRFVPRDRRVVLGLVSSKVGAFEEVDALARRIDEAARFVPLEQLALSPQCGFSSTVHGNDITAEVQAAKLRLVVETATKVWGGL
jgi:5-methyltetrahydropteroyltriglutamate--homocysteine methyltransferase